MGSLNIERVAQSGGLQQYVTLDEYCSLYSYLVPNVMREHPTPQETAVSI
jgi:hypothetical protein